MMASDGFRAHPSWEEMRTFLEADSPTLHAIDGRPPVSIFVEPSVPRIGLRVPFAGREFDPAPPLAEIDVAVGSFRGAPGLELATRNPLLFPYFYSFALTLTDRIQVDGVAVAEAVDRSLDQWRALFRRVSMLSDDEQTGLTGELWMLERLAGRSAKSAIAAWTGPRGEAHDFRLDDREFEVKTTRGNRRIHLIGSMSQLVPSPGRQLLILSLQFAAAGATGGESLNERLLRLRALFDRDGLGTMFDELVMNRYGLSEKNRGHYRERLQLRSEPRLVVVSDDLPCLREQDILAIPRSEMERISDVRYRLDLTGLGFPDDSPEFLSFISAEASS